jgi:hypothetical protein
MRARLRRSATAGLLLVSAALSGCTAGAMLAPIPQVDVGTHTAAIAEPAPMRPATERQPSAVTSDMGYPGPRRIADTEIKADRVDDFAGTTPRGTIAETAPHPLRSYPSAEPSYAVPAAQAVLSEPGIDRQPARDAGSRYAMLPPARPGDTGASRTFSPPASEPKDIPRAAPSPAPPAARDFPRSDVMPADEAALRSELKRLGVRYVDLPPIHERGVCGIDYPVKVTGLSGGIELKPAAVLNARMAVTFAKYVRKDFAPAVRSRYFSGIETIYTGSTYSCRNMIGESTNHLSEHAKGNAIDVMKIRLNSGRVIDVTSPGFFAFRQKGFLNRVRAEACDYFTTVLGPGYNRAHANHFHFDLKQRRNGYVACR